MLLETFNSHVEYLAKPPSLDKIAEVLGRRPEKVLYIVDRKLARQPVMASWLKGLPLVYKVSGGEKLKDFSAFPGHVNKIGRLLQAVSSQSLCVVAVGGGSVGDFAGFFASVFKRGVPLVQIPTTVLAALDSAHGGKNGLNFRSSKNQIGTFYPAKAVLIVRKFFEHLPAEQLRSAAGELGKMALLKGGELFSELQQSDLSGVEGFWNQLPSAVAAKYEIIAEDPLERTGVRQILNFGHTFGHVLESIYELPHGVAVGLGMEFAVEWSFHRGYLKPSEKEIALRFLREKISVVTTADFVKRYKYIPRSKLTRILSQDKKMIDSHTLQYIFLDGIGKPLRRAVTLDSILTEALRQGWVNG